MEVNRHGADWRLPTHGVVGNWKETEAERQELSGGRDIISHIQRSRREFLPAAGSWKANDPGSISPTG